MISQYTKELIEEHEWTFIPSHDVYVYGTLTAVPECWEHPNYGTRYKIEEVLDIITTELDNPAL
jgi:hypothetical protein